MKYEKRKRSFSFLFALIFSGTLLSGFTTLRGEMARDDRYPRGYYPGDPLPERVVYLTFDDGPGDWTGDILDILKGEKIQATFFVCALWAPDATRERSAFIKYRSVLLRIIEEGHLLGNHTLGHARLNTLSEENILRQLDGNQAFLDTALGSRTRRMIFIRPPYGSPWTTDSSLQEKNRVGKAIGRRGLLVLWTRYFNSFDSAEWTEGEWYKKGPRFNPNTPEYQKKVRKIYARLIGRINGGGVVLLLHDTHPTTKDVLPALIRHLKEKNYRFQTLEDYVRWRWHQTARQLLEEQDVE